MKRHKEALGIQQGARNVRAIARSLLEASDEAAREGIGAEQDAAVRMIVHQLAKVCNVDEIKFGFDPASLRDVYCTLMAECEERANEIVVQPVRHNGIPERREGATTNPVQRCEQTRGDTVVVISGSGKDRGRGAEEEVFSEAQEERRGLLSRFFGRV